MSWEALDLALTLHAAPGLVGELRGRPLPAGITRLLRVALGQPDSLAEASEVTGQSAARLVDAARFFVEQQLLAREVEHDPWRVLGVHPQGSEIELRANHHLLVRLVHPDRGDDWASAHAERVNRAWRLLRHAEDRAALVVTPPTAASATAEAWTAQHVDVPAPAPLADAVPPPAARRGYRRWATAAIATVVATAAVWWSIPSEDDRTAAVAPPPPADWYADAQIDSFESADGMAAPLDELVPIAAIAPISADAIAAPTAVADPPSSSKHGEPAPSLTDGPPRSAASERPTSKRSPLLPTPGATTTSTSTLASSSSVVETSASAVVQLPIPDAVDTLMPDVGDPTAATAQPLDADAGQALLREFRSRYAEGDLGGLLQLYAREVHAEHRYFGQIANEYSRLFKNSQQRYIDFSDVHWRRLDDRLLGNGRYETGYRRLGNLRKHLERGRVEVELVLEGDESRLRRFERLQGSRS